MRDDGGRMTREKALDEDVDSGVDIIFLVAQLERKKKFRGNVFVF